MATRDITVRVRAEIGNFKRDMDTAAQAAQKAADKATKAGTEAQSGIGKLTSVAEQNSQAWGMVSTGLVAGGAAIVGGLGLATRAAIQWESAWAGVTKTVDGSPEQLAQLESELRGLAKTLPSTHTEIAGVAEAAGQLGVAREDVTGFTKTMVDLGESTNLTAEDAATNIAQISNVMGTMGREGSEGVERFGATLVELGNNGASTESEILAMAQRISGAAATVGASEVDVLALSNTLASMGVNAELGGGVVTRVLLKMRTAVDEGGESLDSFAKVAGLSAEDFATKFREAPVEAMDLLSQGIGSANAAGENITATLAELGIKGTQETQVMLALANSGDLLSDSLSQGNDAWRENSALVDEAGKRYETAESRIAIAWNNIKDAAIDVGGVIAPVVANIADGISTVAEGFGSMSEPAKTALTVLGSVAGVAALATGGFMKLAPMVIQTATGLKALKAAAPGAVSVLGKLGGAATIATAGIVGLQILGSVITKKHVEDAGNLADGIKRVAESAKNGAGANEMKSWNGVFQSFKDGQGALNSTKTALDELNDSFSTWSTVAGADRSQGIRGITDAIEVLGNPSFMDGVNENLNFMNEWFNLPDDRITEMKDRFADLGVELANFASTGDMETVSTTFSEMQGSFADAGIGANEMLNYFPALRDELRGIAEEAGVTVSQSDLVSWAMTGIQPAAVSAAQGLNETEAALGANKVSAQEAADAIDAYRDSLVQAGLVVLNEREALRGFQDAVASANAALAENGATLDINTEKGRANQAALDGIASAALSTFDTYREGNGTISEMAGALASGREEFINMATGMGMSSSAAAALADSMGLIPENVVTTFDSNADDIGNHVRDLHDIIQATPNKTITIEDNSPEVRKALEDMGYVIKTLPDGRIEVTDDGTAAVTGKKADAVAEKYREAQIKAQATNTGAASNELDGVARNRDAPIIASASTSAAEGQLNWVARPRTSYLQQQITQSVRQINNGPVTGQFGKYMGGKLPSRAEGGRLPYTGLGRDMILGVGGDGRPVANVDDGEWVIREKSASKYDKLLGLINRDDPSVQGLASLATGGKVGRKQAEVDKLQRRFSLMPGDKKNKARKAALKADLYDAKYELKQLKAEAAASKKSSAAAKKRTEAENKKAKEAREKAAAAAKAEAERRGRVGDMRFELSRDLKRGTITDSFTSGGGMSEVDKLFAQSKNKDLSKGSRSGLRAAAYGIESQMLSLEKRSESLKEKMDKATEARDRLLEVSKSVADGLRGEYSLGGVLSNLIGGETKGPLNARSFIKSAQGKAVQIRKFGELLAKLRNKGYNDAIIQEIADLGTTEGTQVGTALLNASGTERRQLNNAYESMDYWSSKAGVEVTKSMKQGGIDSAQGVIDGLASKQKDVENAFYKLGKQAEGAFRRSLDMHSPSRSMRAAGVDSLDGILLGEQDKHQSVVDSYSKLGYDVEAAYQPVFADAAPPSMEVARYAQAQSASTTISAEDIARAFQSVVSGWQPVVSISGRDFYGTMQQVMNQVKRP